jgi:hypothetical protein
MARQSSDKVWRKLRSTLKQAQGMSVNVGIIGQDASEAHAGTELTNAEIGFLHEYGVPSINLPERSWLRSTFTVRRAELVQLQAAAARGLLAQRYTVAHALGLIGSWAAGAVREQITKYGPFLFVPLKPATIARKGRSSPLVDTGQLVNSISYVVLRA